MGEMTRQIVRIPAVEDPETGQVWDAKLDRLTLSQEVGEFTVVVSTVLHPDWDTDTREAVEAALRRTLEEEIDG